MKELSAELGVPWQTEARQDHQSLSDAFSPWVWRGMVVVCALVVTSGGAVLWLVLRAIDDPVPVSADALVVFAGESARVQLALELSNDLETAGIAPVVVFSHGLENPLVADRCGQRWPVEVLCLAAESSNTRGEAQMFGALVNERGWQSVAAVTGDYHLARARTLLSRCVGESVDVAFVTVDWDNVAMRVYLHETAGLWLAHVTTRAC